MTCGLVRIRLARFGRRNMPLYNIVVTQRYKARDAKPIEVIGIYNPIPKKLDHDSKRNDIFRLSHDDSTTTNSNEVHSDKLVKEIKLDFNRAKYWIGCGAQPTETVAKLFIRAGILNDNWLKYEGKIDRGELISAERTVLE